jgi:hypothetical protein
LVIIISKVVLRERLTSMHISCITRQFSPSISSSEIRHEG